MLTIAEIAWHQN